MSRERSSAADCCSAIDIPRSVLQIESGRPVSASFSASSPRMAIPPEPACYALSRRHDMEAVAGWSLRSRLRPSGQNQYHWNWGMALSTSGY
jgi:hypothetical protein